MSPDQSPLELALRFASAVTVIMAAGLLFSWRNKLHPKSTWRYLGIVITGFAFWRTFIFILALIDQNLTRSELVRLAEFINELNQTFAILIGLSVAVVAKGAHRR